MFERRSLLLVVTVALIAMCAVILSGGTDEAGVRMVIRATARTSLVLFLAAFAASSLRRFVDARVTAWLLRNRRYVGLSFAVSHALHLAAIVVVAMRWPHPFMEQSAQPLRLIGGGLGYVLLALMVLTSNDVAVRMLGSRRWRLLHLVGSWILWVIFLQSYAGRAMASRWALVAALVILGVAALRVAAWRRR
jgi:methionine sulfoxide reductase heme-binding subunit